MFFYGMYIGYLGYSPITSQFWIITLTTIALMINDYIVGYKKGLSDGK